MALQLTLAGWALLEIALRVRERLQGRGGAARDRATSKQCSCIISRPSCTSRSYSSPPWPLSQPSSARYQPPLRSTSDTQISGCGCIRRPQANHRDSAPAAAHRSARTPHPRCSSHARRRRHAGAPPRRPGSRPLPSRRVLARADREHHAAALTRAHDDVVRVRRAVHEIPAPEGSLLALHDQQRLAIQHKKVLLVGLPVVNPGRLAGVEHVEIDAHLRERRVAFEPAAQPPPRPLQPARRARIDDEPAVPSRDQPMLRPLQRGLRDHARTLSHHDERGQLSSPGWC